MKKISVIMPVYNGEKHIEQTLLSVINQTLINDIELIIINDGSTDNSLSILEEYKKKYSDTIVLINKENTGVSDSRNIGIKTAKGQYITFIDSDDIYEINYVEKLYNTIQKGYDLVSCNYTNFEANNNTISINSKFETEDIGIYYENLSKKYLFNQLWNKIYKSDIIRKNNILFDVKKSIAEDWEFNIKYLSKCKKMMHINDVLYNYRVTSTGLGFKYRTDSNHIKFEILDLTQKIFDEKGINSDYLHVCYVVQSFSFFSITMDCRNKISFKEKRNLIKRFINSEEYCNMINKLQIKNKKYKVMISLLKIKSVWIICLLGVIANKYDKYKKRKTFGIKGGR